MMAHRFNPDHAERLLSEQRQAMLPADRVLDALALGGGMVFADVGVGPGYFALPAALRTGATVYAVDVEPRMLERLRERVKTAGLSGQFAFLEGDACAVPLPDASVLRTLCSFVLHEVSDLSAAVSELARITKPGGIVGLAEWEKIPANSGPPESVRLERRQLLSAVENIGFERVESVQLNAEQYLLVCHKPAHTSVGS